MWIRDYVVMQHRIYIFVYILLYLSNKYTIYINNMRFLEHFWTNIMKSYKMHGYIHQDMLILYDLLATS
jgi:hypothetical protein